MEVQDQLKRKLAEVQRACSADEASGPVSEASYAGYAKAAVDGIVATLKNFDPEVSKERLSVAVHGLVHAESLAGPLGPQLRAALREYVPRERAAWLASDVEGHLAAKAAWLRTWYETIARRWASVRARTAVVSGDPKTRAVVLAGGGSAALLGAVGGTFGTIAGAWTGATVGLVPAILTFGISIPMSAMVGGSIGAWTGGTAGSVTGMVGGSAAGRVMYAYRTEIREGVSVIRVRVLNTVSAARQRAAGAVERTQTRAIEWSSSTRTRVSEVSAKLAEATVRAREATGEAAETSAVRARELAERAKYLALDKKVQATTVSAASGAMIMGTGGGVAGFLGGGAIGMAIGIVPAMFTFGLSIPIGAAVGSGWGLAVGTATGGAAGLVTGGATGYGVYTRRDEISSGATEAWTKVGTLAESVRERAGRLVRGA